MTAANIDDNIKVLVVDHPRGITDAGQYAIDQFVMRGGKVIAFLDPTPISIHSTIKWRRCSVQAPANPPSPSCSKRGAWTWT